MDFKQIVDAISTLGTLGFALLAVYAFLKELIVPRSRLDEQRADKKEAMDLANRALAISERLADDLETAERVRQEVAREQAAREARR